MAWNRRLPRPIYLNDGRKVGTLAQARDVLLAFPQAQYASEHWLGAAETLIEAAHKGGRDLALNASRRFAQAMATDGLISRERSL